MAIVYHETSRNNDARRHVNHNFLVLRRPGIDTYQEPVVYMRSDCDICRAEGFSSQNRVQVSVGERHITATVHMVTSELLHHNEAGLSEAAWHLLGATDGEHAHFSHPAPVESMSFVRGKLYGNRFSEDAARAVIGDIRDGHYSDIQLAAYVTACADALLDTAETIAITRAMVESGQRFDWGRTPVMDKHCVGGLPGNRTTPIVVAIATACGLLMPKTSSRAITSPAGTADTMETLAPVDLSFEHMRRVVEQEGGCIAWGGSVSLSPTDDIVIRVERALDLDSEGQLVASVISKKVAAGATHVLIDMPVGPTAKVRQQDMARRLTAQLIETGAALGVQVSVLQTDGTQPVGRGIGPALEARDILQVLRRDAGAPQDLRERALTLAGALLELGGAAAAGQGLARATATLDSGAAWQKFRAICAAQGGMREPPLSHYQHPVVAERGGVVAHLNMRSLAKAAKLAGAPADQAAGIEMHVHRGEEVERGQPLYTMHADTRGELHYALDYLKSHPETLSIEDPVR
jgi:thymidine phosphorylase